jgi:uncharacterized membrane protein
MLIFSSLVSLLAIFFFNSTINAQELHQDFQGTLKVEITEVVLKARITDGERKGEIVEIENDLYDAKVGQDYFVSNIKTFEGIELYRLSEPDRLTGLYIIFVIFVLAVVAFGRGQGVRALLSLILSFCLIIFFLLPQMLNGASPVLISVITAVAILAFAIFTTHGFNKTSVAAFLGTSISTVVTGVFAYVSVKALVLTGFVNDEVTYLNLSTQGELNISGLLLGGIIIGALGVLDDIAITQASVVRELRHAAPHLSEKEIFTRALRVGREHVGALINTLALAYTGAALPLLLYFYGSQAPITEILNREVFTTEIVRTIAGSIGLILAVPITTWFSTFLFNSKRLSSLKEGDGHHH